MVTHGIWFVSFLVYGLLLQALKGQEDAEYSTSSWNQNQHRHRSTNEPLLGAYDLTNTRDDSEELEPVANPRGVVISKAVPGQKMHRDVLNSGYVVSDGRRMSRKHMHVKQTQKRTTIEPRHRVFDRIHTTDVYKEFEPVASNQPQKSTTTEPQQEVFGRTITKDGFEEFEPVSKHRPQNKVTIVPQQGVFDRISTTVDSEEFEPVTNNEPQRHTTTKPRLGVFGRTNATDNSEEFEPVTQNQPQTQTTTAVPLGVMDRMYTTVNSVTRYKSMVINKPVKGQEMQSVIMSQGNGNRIRLIHDGVINVQAVKSRAKPENTVNTLVKRENVSKGQVRSLYSVINRSKETSLQRKQTAENDVNIRNR